MKYQKLFLSAAIGCLLLGASGASMADDCADGVIAFEAVPEIVINGQACVIYGATVAGKVEVRNSPVLSMSATDVGGSVTIQNDQQATGQQAVVLGVDILKGNLTVTGYKAAVVAGNTVQLGNLAVNNNLVAFLSRNSVNGNILCTDNAELDAGGNRATGEVNCTPE